MKKRTIMLTVAAIAVVALGAGGSYAIAARSTAQSRLSPDAADPLHTAVQRLSSVIVYDIMSPPQSSRVYAYSSVAAYETLRHGHPEYRSLAGQLNGLEPAAEPQPGVQYDWPLAGVEAFMTVGRAMTFSRQRMDSLRTVMQEEARRRGVAAPVFARSIAYGDSIAAHILKWSAADHFLQTRGYPKFSVTSALGRWVPTPPAYMDAVEANWRELRPFVLDSASQFRPIAPPRFDTLPGSEFYKSAKEVHDVGVNLTEEQRAIAAFWDCNPYVMNVTGHAMFATKKISPGGHWMGIVGLASRRAHADIMRSAEAYARASITMADAFIGTWDEKYRSAVIRPETVINKYIDERWQPLLQTPPFPEYPSGHSVVSTAVAAVLANEFGSPFAFADSAELQFGLPVRTFPSFEAAASEAAISRLYGGIHYRPAIEQGVVLGRRVGALVVARVSTRVTPGVVASAAPGTIH
ncbi:MAG: phosphoesterase PA-phosphatase related protein [Gemmatimonadetes bacterium]|nr:phosphoesterase PA-phosphatase related protein [Gemmatimonadota bacterium]